jgi:KaiC/GvpD/RAD55 family RecA-like ATPase
MYRIKNLDLFTKVVLVVLVAVVSYLLAFYVLQSFSGQQPSSMSGMMGDMTNPNQTSLINNLLAVLIALVAGSIIFMLLRTEKPKERRTQTTDIEFVKSDSEITVLADRITTGTKELDTIMMGGIPENFAIILTGSPSEERELLIKNFIEIGAKKGQITAHITEKEPSSEIYSEKFPNSYLFVCKSRADSNTPKNTYKLQGLNLTNLNIAITKAFRSMNLTKKGPKRIAIEIISDVLFHYKGLETRRWLQELILNLKSKGFTILAVMNPTIHPPDQTNQILELFDGEISIETIKLGIKTKILQIKKLVGKEYNNKPILM